MFQIAYGTASIPAMLELKIVRTIGLKHERPLLELIKRILLDENIRSNEELKCQMPSLE